MEEERDNEEYLQLYGYNNNNNTTAFGAGIDARSVKERVRACAARRSQWKSRREEIVNLASEKSECNDDDDE